MNYMKAATSGMQMTITYSMLVRSWLAMRLHKPAQPFSLVAQPEALHAQQQFRPGPDKVNRQDCQKDAACQ